MKHDADAAPESATTRRAQQARRAERSRPSSTTSSANTSCGGSPPMSGRAGSGARCASASASSSATRRSTTTIRRAARGAASSGPTCSTPRAGPHVGEPIRPGHQEPEGRAAGAAHGRDPGRPHPQRRPRRGAALRDRCGRDHRRGPPARAAGVHRTAEDQPIIPGSPRSGARCSTTSIRMAPKRRCRRRTAPPPPERAAPCIAAPCTQIQ